MKVYRVVAIAVLASATLMAASPMDDYVVRLGRASAVMAELSDADRDQPTDVEIAMSLEAVKDLVPASGEVVFGNETIRIDNTDLVRLLDRLQRRYRSREGSDADRRDELVELAGRVTLLADRVSAAAKDIPAVGIEDRRVKLESILARPEYQPEVRQESRVQKWINRAWDAFLRFLNSLVASQGDPPPTPGRASLDVIRVLIALGLVFALVMGSYYLIRRLRKRRPKPAGGEDKRDVREVLGEEISGDMTVQELLANAAELARQGDYRSAIRRGFIALLFELEDRGKVRLDRAKTNHDYLNEVRGDVLVEPVSAMTIVFERVWYGERGASSEDYAEFLKRWPLSS